MRQARPQPVRPFSSRHVITSVPFLHLTFHCDVLHFQFRTRPGTMRGHPEAQHHAVQQFRLAVRLNPAVLSAHEHTARAHVSIAQHAAHTPHKPTNDIARNASRDHTARHSHATHEKQHFSMQPKRTAESTALHLLCMRAGACVCARAVVARATQ